MTLLRLKVADSKICLPQPKAEDSLERVCFRTLLSRIQLGRLHEPISAPIRICLTIPKSGPSRPMTAINGSDQFYGGIPVFRGFGRLMDPALYSPLPDDWTIGVADIVESTRGDRGGALQGGQHGRRRDHRRRHQCAGGPRISVRVRRRRRELRGVARRPRVRPRGAGGDRDLGQGRSRSRNAGGAGAGQGGARARPRRPRGAVRAVAEFILCDGFPAAVSAGRKPR